MPKQSLNTILDSNEVAILLKVVDGKTIDFKVCIGDNEVEDKDLEQKVRSVFCLAVGLVAEAKDNPAKHMMKGAIVGANIVASTQH